MGQAYDRVCPKCDEFIPRRFDIEVSTEEDHRIFGRVGDAAAIWDVFGKQVYKHLDIGPGSVVLDVGANIGCFTLWAIERCTERVVAIEPLPANLGYLRANLAPFGDKVEIIPKAVWSTPGELEMWWRASFSAATAIRKGNGIGSKAHRTTVEAIELQPILTEVKPTHVKIDIEGSEYVTVPGLVYPPEVEMLHIELHFFFEGHPALAEALLDELEREWTYHSPRSRPALPKVRARPRNVILRRRLAE